MLFRKLITSSRPSSCYILLFDVYNFKFSSTILNKRNKLIKIKIKVRLKFNHWDNGA